MNKSKDDECSEEHPPSPPQTGNDAVRVQRFLRAQKFLHETVRHAYDIDADDQRLREGILREGITPEERGKYFDKLRHEYPMRREFPNYVVRSTSAHSKFCEQLFALGFSNALEKFS